MVVAMKKTQAPAQHLRAHRFGDWLVQELRDRGLSPLMFAQHVQLSDSTVYNWLTGNTLPTVEACRRVSVALGVDECVVRELVGNPSKTRKLPVANITPISAHKAVKPEPQKETRSAENNITAALYNVLSELKKQIASEETNVQTFKRYAQAPAGERFECVAREADARLVALLFTQYLIKEQFRKVGVTL